MKENLHIIVTCTNSKSEPPDPRLKISNSEFQVNQLTESDLDQRANRWISAIEECNEVSENKIDATNLYSGAHWKVAKGLTSKLNSNNWGPKLWILSAGYGLLSEHSKLVSYNASFSTGKEDSIFPKNFKRNHAQASREYRLNWWEKLQNISVGKESDSKSLSELGSKDHKSKFLIACSMPYLQAISLDIKSIKNFEERVFLITQPIGDNQLEACRVGSTIDRPYSDLKTYTYGQFGTNSHLGAFTGSMMSLNVQIADHLLSFSDRHNFSRKELNTEFEELIGKCPKRPKIKKTYPKGKTVAEQEEFIRRDIQLYLKLVTKLQELNSSHEKDTQRNDMLLLFHEFRDLFFEPITFNEEKQKFASMKVFDLFEKRIRLELKRPLDHQDFTSIKEELLLTMANNHITLTPSASSALRWYRVVLFKRKEEKRFRDLYKEETN